MKNLYLLLLICCNALTAQEKILEGSFKDLASISHYNVVFDYEGQKVDRFDTEEAFLEDKTGKREGEKAEDFRRRWFEYRSTYYEPKFIDYFNKRMNGSVTVGKNADAYYTILIKTLWIYPGYHVGIGREESKISAVITVYETANPSHILLKVKYDKSPGIEPTEDAHNPGNRIAGSYEKLARNFTMQLKRFIK